MAIEMAPMTRNRTKDNENPMKMDLFAVSSMASREPGGMARAHALSPRLKRARDLQNSRRQILSPKARPANAAR